MGTKDGTRDPDFHRAGDAPIPHRGNWGERISKSTRRRIEQDVAKLLAAHPEIAEIEKNLAEIYAETRTVQSAIRKKSRRRNKLCVELGDLSQSLDDLHQREKFLWALRTEEQWRRRLLEAVTVEQVRHGYEQADAKR